MSQIVQRCISASGTIVGNQQFHDVSTSLISSRVIRQGKLRTD
jgi:hypothetical protein